MFRMNVFKNCDTGRIFITFTLKSTPVDKLKIPNATSLIYFQTRERLHFHKRFDERIVRPLLFRIKGTVAVANVLPQREVLFLSIPAKSSWLFGAAFAMSCSIRGPHLLSLKINVSRSLSPNTNNNGSVAYFIRPA